MLEDTSEQVSDSLHTAVRVIGETSTGKDFKMIEPVRGSQYTNIGSSLRMSHQGASLSRIWIVDSYRNLDHLSGHTLK